MKRITNRPTSRRRMLQTLGALGVAAGAGSILAPSAIAQQRPRRGGTLAIGTDVFPLDLVPSSTTAVATTSVTPNIYEGLVGADPVTGSGAEPLLAESWTVSPDGMVYTFKLRRGVKFHDGTEFNSEAVMLNIERLLKPDSRYYYKVGGPIAVSQVYSSLERAEAVDPYTVRYHMKQANADFIYLLKRAYAGFISPAVIKNYPPEEVAKHASGTGPFRVGQREEGSRLVLERFDGYWRGAPYLDRLVYRPFGEAGAREAALLSGDVDLIHYAQIDSIEKLKGRFTPLAWGLSQAFLVALNTRHPFTKDEKVRQALNYAVNRDALAKSLFKGLVVPSKGPYSPSNAAWNPALKAYPYDPARARKLLAEAGASGAKVKALMPTQVAGIPLVSETAQSIQADLRAVGVELSYDQMEWTAYLAKVRPGLTEEHIFYITGWGSDAMFWMEQLLGKNFQPPKGANRGWYENAEVEKLFEQGRGEFDQAKRKALYQRAEEIIVREAPWLFTVYYTDLGLRSQKLEGLKLGYWSFDYSKAWLKA